MTRESLAPRLAAALEAYDVTPSFEREEHIASGNLAFERGWDVQEVRPRAGGETRTQRQHVFLVLRRGDDGKWRFARDLSQSDRLTKPYKPVSRIRAAAALEA